MKSHKTIGVNIACSLLYLIWFVAVIISSLWKLWPLKAMNLFIPTVGPRLIGALCIWIGFVGLFTWAPVGVAMIRRSEAFRILASSAAFMMSFFLAIILCTIIWENTVVDTLYDCSDPLGFDFVQPPGEWVHNPVTVDHVTRHHTMSDPDTIKKGWTNQKLECLRWIIVAMVAGISFIPARFVWQRMEVVEPLLKRKPKNLVNTSPTQS